MMKVLVTAASRHGATMGIADVIADELTVQGLTAESLPVQDVYTLTDYDAVVLGSAIYFGHWLNAAIDFADLFTQELSDRPLWLFSSGPVEEVSTSASPDSDSPRSPIKGILQPREHRVFAGLLEKSRLGLAERAVVSLTHGAYGDYRDWSAVRAWARSIGAALTSPADEQV
jgi:menaquinone-dependent protoporphyrinogen oxidase